MPAEVLLSVGRSAGAVGEHRAAVLGRPIAHSLSPLLHNAGYAASGLTGWHYSAHLCGKSELAPFVAGLGPEWAGLSLTMPLKEAALAVAQEVSVLAAALGAANTLVRRGDGSWWADNTDAPGMVDVLSDLGVSTAERVSVLGAGGTARAALAAARELGASVVTVYARRADAVAELTVVAQRLGVTMAPASWADTIGGAHSGAGGRSASDARGAGDADVVISTVPAGAADSVAAAMRWRPKAVLLDAIYNPWPTPLAVAAHRAGCRVGSGLDLLLAQAAHQFELFTGVPAPRDAMREALTAAVLFQLGRGAYRS